MCGLGGAAASCEEVAEARTPSRRSACPSCQPDFSSLCPKAPLGMARLRGSAARTFGGRPPQGWLVQQGGSCEAPAAYGGPCASTAFTGRMSGPDKAEYELRCVACAARARVGWRGRARARPRCRVCWPCGSGAWGRARHEPPSLAVNGILPTQCQHPALPPSPPKSQRGHRRASFLDALRRADSRAIKLRAQNGAIDTATGAVGVAR